MALLVSNQDIQAIKKMQADLHKVGYRKLEVYVRDVSVSVDTLYLEDPNFKPYEGEKFLIPAYVKVNPQKVEWTKFGIEERRDLKVVFSTQVLTQGYRPSGSQDRVPFPEPSVGTVIKLLGEPYVVVDIIPQDYFGNTEQYMTLVAFAIKWRPSRMIDKTFDVPTKDAEPPVTNTYRDDVYD